MKRFIPVYVLLFMCVSIFAHAALTADQLKYMGANFVWDATGATKNIHGTLLLSDNQINYTMGYSTANGKWYHFVIGAASATLNIGSGVTEALTVRTMPINVDGYSRATITPYVVTGAAANFTTQAATTVLTCSLQPEISVIPYNTIGTSSTYGKQIMKNAPLNVASAGTAQLGAGAVISAPGAMHYDLMGAKSLIVSVSGLAAGVSLTATTCFMIGLSK